jgi:hypothetical protein
MPLFLILRIEFQVLVLINQRFLQLKFSTFQNTNKQRFVLNYTPKGATDVSQAVKANKASMFYLEKHLKKVNQYLNLSSGIVFQSFDFDFPFSLAFKILSIKVVVFVENGI